MAEPDTIEEETAKTEDETGKNETTEEPMSTDAAEPKAEENTEEKKEEKSAEKKEEKKDETMETGAAQVSKNFKAYIEKKRWCMKVLILFLQLIKEKTTEQDSMAEDPDSIPSLQLAWEMIELARIIYKQRAEVIVRIIKIIRPS